jgi:Capsule polysaccharide biosynthesis protein
MNCRVVVYGFHATELVPAIRSAVQGIGEVVHWIGVNRDGQSFDEDIVAWHLGEQLCLPSLESASQCGREAARTITERNFPQIADQLKRNPFCARMSNDQLRSLSERLFIKFDTALADKKVNLVVFQNLPHEGFELLLYFAAQNRRVRTVLCYQSILPNRFFYCESLDDFGFFRSCELEPAEPFVMERQFEKYLFYMEGLPSKLQEPQVKSPHKTHDSWKQRWRRLGTKLKQKTGYYRLRGKQPIAVDPQVEYEINLQNAINKTASINSPFVYFPLHLQPELTTSAIGDEYADQLRAIEELAQWLPSSVAVYVKENPKQTHRWRDAEFFARLQKVPRLKLIPTETSTYHLLRDCLFAATITGTVGWESISGGKPVLVFGRPWYLTLPGVFHFRDQSAFENVLNCKFSHAEFCNAVSELLRKSRPGIVDINYRRSLPDFDPETNSRAIAEFLRHQVTKTRALMV